MKKLIVLGVVAFIAVFSVTAEAQISVNVNIGPRPQYVPVRYFNTGYYYGAPARPVYVNRVYTVKHNRYNNWKPVRTRYVGRPVVYKRAFYKNNRGPKHSYYKIKSYKHGRGHARNVHSKGRR